MGSGRVVGVFVGTQARQPLAAVSEVRAEPGQGLEGDRYWARQGTFWKPVPDREVTLIEEEALEALARESGVELEPRDARRNIATRGVRLNDLVGGRFRVGEVVLEGIRLCEPCSHLESLVGRKLRPMLNGHGGLRARIIAGGVIHVGDSIDAEAQLEPATRG